MSRFSFLALGCVILGCASTGLTAAGAKVQLMKADPPAGCKELGSVDGSHNYVGRANEAASKNVLRNRAADLGANYVRMETVSSAGIIAGTAYQCP